MTEYLNSQNVSGEDPVTQELFRNPPACYRGTPFWAWNSELEPEKLVQQIHFFKEMGFGGFYMHSRSGLTLPYMSDAFLDRVQLCVEQAAQIGLVPHLYDEDTWPSGFAGGKAVKDHPEYRRSYLVFTPKDNQSAQRTVGRYDICLNEDGTLASYRLLQSGEQASWAEWVAQIKIEENSARFGLSAYIDTLNPDAVRHFVSLTHEAYLKKLGTHFGTTVPSIFTDEPRITRNMLLKKNQSTGFEEAILSWTDQLPQSFYEATGTDLVAHLPELVWDLEGHKPSKIRWQYYDQVSEMFAQAYFGTIGAWCDNAGIAFAGHLMDEYPLHKSVAVSGDAMRCYRSMTIPGIDMLCGNREYTTAKQAQSIVRQMGKNGMLSELYGVIGWDGDFREHKLHGDWQAALGVTQRVHHLAWFSMRGYRKRDYPQSIFYQSPWYREYPLIEDHFARVGLAMTQGKAVCRIGLIHPIETFWLNCGTEAGSRPSLNKIEEDWKNVAEWILLGGYDFDFISESMLLQLCEAGSAPLQVGKSNYDVIVVPNCETLRRSTLERLKQFRNDGGTLIFMGEPPVCVDAVPDSEPIELAKRSIIIPFERDAVLAALSEFRDIILLNEDGSAVNDLLYQLREDQHGRWLFLAQGKKPDTSDDMTARSIRLEMNGDWTLEIYDTMSGDIKPLYPDYVDDKTVITISLYPHDSLLLRLKKGKSEKAPAVSNVNFKHEIQLAIPKENSFTLSEPNALLLDMAEYKLDDEPWQPAEEILRLDRRCRKKLDWHGGVQPWLIPDEVPVHTLSLRFRIHSDIELSGVHLALENAQKVNILWNGEAVSNRTDGWYVDQDIQTLPIPSVKVGENILELKILYEKKETVEWCYLLGDFGVEVHGREKRLIKQAGRLSFGSIVTQGLPFYSGAVTYHIPFSMTDTGTLSVCIPNYHAALLKCSIDDAPECPIAFSPYEMRTEVTKGDHMLHLTAYINRTNGFGPVHNADPNLTWFSPEAWTSTGDFWTYEYVLQEEGIMDAPVLTLRTN